MTRAFLSVTRVFLSGTRVSLSAAVAIAGLAAGCSAAGEDPRVNDLRADVGRLRADLEAQRKLIDVLERDNRAFSEQLAAVGVRPAPAKAPSPAPGAKPATPESADAPSDPVVASLESEAGRAKVEAIVHDLQRREQEEREKKQSEATVKRVRDWVEGTLAEQLGLDEQQKKTVGDILATGAEKGIRLWAQARDGGLDAEAIASLRTKGAEIRTEAEDKLKQALTAEQFQKFQEVSGRAMGGMGFGMGFGGGGPGGGNAGAGGGTFPARRAGGEAPR